MLSVESQAASLTLKQALELAQSHNRNIAVLQNRIKENDERISQAKAPFLPQFRLNGNYTYVSRLPEIKVDLPLPVKFPAIAAGTHNVLDANVSAGYLLYDWGKRKSALMQARIGRDISQTNLAGASDEIAYQTIKLYAAASLQTENVKLMGKYVEIADKHLKDAQNKFANGLVSQYDLLKSEMQLKVYQEQQSIANSDFQAALLNLTEVCGVDNPDTISPSEELRQMSLGSPQVDKFDSLIANKPQIVALQKQQELSKTVASVERLRPTFSAVSSTGWKNNYMPDPDKLSFNYVGGVSFSFPLFDGGYASHRRQEEQEKQKSTQLDINRIKSESRRHLQVINQELSKIQAKMQITEEKLKLARKALEIASVSYGVGLITNSDYLDTEFETEKIEYESLQDRFNLLINQLELKKELGFFPESSK